MKNLFFLFIAFGLLAFTSCKDDDTTMDGPEYSVNIVSPTDFSEFDSGDELTITVDFEEANSDIIHHINLKIYRKDDPNSIVFNAPDEAHLHEESGKYTFTETVTLDHDFTGGEHGDYILEAKVWGHEAGAAEVTEIVQFHVHPM